MCVFVLVSLKFSTSSETIILEPEPEKVSKKDKKSKKKGETEEGSGDSKKSKKMAKILAQMDDEIEPDVEVWGFFFVAVFRRYFHF